MDSQRQAHWVARVVAWHNRHPLARRIAAADVQSLGYVDLPYSAGDTTKRRGWRAVFSEDFLPGLRRSRIVRWALRYGDDQVPVGRDAPVRALAIDRQRLPADGLALVLWVGTAAIQQGERQTRVLIGPTPPYPVLGHHLWSRPRVAAAAVTLALLLTPLPLLKLLQRPAVVDDDEPVVAHTPALVKPALLAAVAASSPLPALAASAASAAAPAPPASATWPESVRPASVAVLPPPTAPQPFPPRRPRLDEATKIEAQRAVAEARAARATTQGHTVYALATPRVRTQAESEIHGATLQAALANAEVPRGLRVEALPAGRDWRAVCWPLLDRDTAEKLREQLAARGQRIEIVAF